LRNQSFNNANYNLGFYLTEKVINDNGKHPGQIDLIWKVNGRPEGLFSKKKTEGRLNGFNIR